MHYLEKKALAFATARHEGQKRKYTGVPYIEHPIAVAEIVRSVEHTPEMVAAAYLHDVVEDCGVTHLEIRHTFGTIVGSLVFWLTDASINLPANRKARKQLDRDFLALATPEAKTIKLADVIENTADIEQHDPHFWPIYREEKKLLLPSLQGGNQVLLARAYKQVL